MRRSGHAFRSGHDAPRSAGRNVGTVSSARSGSRAVRCSSDRKSARSDAVAAHGLTVKTMAAVTKTYTCAACGGTFIDGRSHEEAAAESREVFGADPDQDPTIAVVCDDCYKAMDDHFGFGTQLKAGKKLRRKP